MNASFAVEVEWKEGLMRVFVAIVFITPFLLHFFTHIISLKWSHNNGNRLFEKVCDAQYGAKCTKPNERLYAHVQGASLKAYSIGRL